MEISDVGHLNFWLLRRLPRFRALDSAASAARSHTPTISLSLTFQSIAQPASALLAASDTTALQRQRRYRQHALDSPHRTAQPSYATDQLSSLAFACGSRPHIQGPPARTSAAATFSSTLSSTPSTFPLTPPPSLPHDNTPSHAHSRPLLADNRHTPRFKGPRHTTPPRSCPLV